ncbi:TREM1 protein, partial [Bucorvus abyssinicus]|nr:TREM1 protein [Bucorvus abyssinicus]
GLQAQTPDAEEIQREGSTLHIQCPYAAQTTYQDPKAWCLIRDREYEVLAEVMYTPHLNTRQVTMGRVTIEDNPMLRTVSITMADLQAEDSNRYSCVYRPYSYTYNYVPLKTISLTVFKELHRWELDSFSVRCKYSALVYSTDTKAWCRRSQASCNIWVTTNHLSSWPNNKALEGRVWIQDDTWERTVTITMQKLQARDTGVYWCALYRNFRLSRIMEVRLSVSKIVPFFGHCLVNGLCQHHAGLPSNIGKPLCSPGFSSNIDTFILSGVLSIIFILALISSIILYVRWHKQPKRRGNGQAEAIYEKPEDIAQLGSTERIESPKDDSEDLKYATINFKSQLSPEDTIYCNVEPSQAHRKPENEDVEYAIIAFK